MKKYSKGLNIEAHKRNSATKFSVIKALCRAWFDPGKTEDLEPNYVKEVQKIYLKELIKRL